MATHAQKEAKASLSLYERVRNKFIKNQKIYKFRSQNEFIDRMLDDFTSNHPDPDNYHPDKIAFDNKHVRTILKHIDKSGQAQLTSIKDIIIQNHRSDGEKKFFTHLISIFNNYIEKQEASEDKDKQIKELRYFNSKLLQENKELKAKLGQNNP